MPSVKWSENWRRRRILPRDGWRSHGCQSHSRRSLPVGDRSAHVERVEPGSEGPMPALWEARVVMEVCKVDLGFALSEAFIEGCREAERTCAMRGAIGAVRWPPSASWCIWSAGGISTGRSIGGRRGRGGVGPGRHYLGTRGCRRIVDSILNYTYIYGVFRGPLSHTH